MGRKMTPKQYLKNVLRTDLKDQDYGPIAIKLYRNEFEKSLKVTSTASILRVLHGAVGMCGESGEVIDKVKKVLIYGKEVDKKDLLNECGDVLWYMTILLHELGYNLEDAMKANVEKLEKRYPNGFNTKDAISRKDEK
jgi:NTP pyrophosphatase (non-canonical NTP hydrolase)